TPARRAPDRMRAESGSVFSHGPPGVISRQATGRIRGSPCQSIDPSPKHEGATDLLHEPTAQAVLFYWSPLRYLTEGVSPGVAAFSATLLPFLQPLLGRPASTPPPTRNRLRRVPARHLPGGPSQGVASQPGGAADPLADQGGHRRVTQHCRHRQRSQGL